MKILSFAFSMILFLAFGVAAAFGHCSLTVAKGGSADAETVQAAIDRVPADNKERCVIKISPGTYYEQVTIPANKPYISLIGESAQTTKITFDLTNKKAGSTSASYSVYIGGHDLYAENITFENSFGTGSQAVAVLVEADRVFFNKCRFLGWQDTLYAKNGRQYYKDCYIEGHVDYIFGQAAAVFENCHIHNKADGYIAAPMRFAADEKSGFVFYRCRLTSSNTEKGVYLGRPWRDYGRTVFIETQMDAAIRPEGWHHWEPHREKTAYFAEYASKGSGGKTDNRVKWAHQLSKSQIDAFLPHNFLRGSDNWTPGKLHDPAKDKMPDFAPVKWDDVLRQPKLWYAVDEATRIANQVLMFQRENGGWEKNVDMAAMLTMKQREKLLAEKALTDTTIDNSATTFQLAYLAKVITAKNIANHIDGFNKGLDFLFAMQYENGGFPQFFPLKKDYSRHITFNDNAMINVLKLFRDISDNKDEFKFVDEVRRKKAGDAVKKAVPLILKTQVEIDGKKTVWAAQYDEITLKPAAARKFEPIALTAGESVGIVRFLMTEKEQTAEIANAVESAVNWYKANSINNIRWTRQNGENRVVADEKAPPIWARFYQIDTMRPIFIGRDAIIRYDVNEIDAERRNGYAWYVEFPGQLINRDYPKWKAAQAK